MNCGTENDEKKRDTSEPQGQTHEMEEQT
jgi:hypothetical protein